MRGIKRARSRWSPFADCTHCRLYITEVNKATAIAKSKINRAKLRQEHIKGVEHASNAESDQNPDTTGSEEPVLDKEHGSDVIGRFSGSERARLLFDAGHSARKDREQLDDRKANT